MIFLFIIVFLGLIFMFSYYGMGALHSVEDEVSTTTVTTVVTEPAEDFVIKGTLKCSLDAEGHRFVIDPVDNATIYLNPGDDMHADANQNIWKLGAQ